MKYDDENYARERLSGTVVRIDGIAVYLQHVDGWLFRAHNLSDKKHTDVDIRKVDIDIKPIPLGYVNYQGNTYYTSRSPARRWKQGLSEDSFNVTQVKRDGKVAKARGGGMITSKELANCINNKYPSFKKAYKNVATGECTGLAFSRKFAVSSSSSPNNPYVLLYRGEKVGVVNYKGINLESKYSFLKEALLEVLK